MDKTRLTRLESEIEKILGDIKIELVDMELKRDNKAMVLRLFIDSDNGINMELCTQATRAVKNQINMEDINYDHLEVSSPGLDRVLKKDKDFIRYTGNKVKIKTSREFDGPKTIVGVMLVADSNYLQVDTGEQVYEIPRQFITTARLKPEI